MKKEVAFIGLFLAFLVTIVLTGNYSAVLLHEAKHQHIFEYAGIDSHVEIGYPFSSSQTVVDSAPVLPAGTERDIMNAQMAVETQEPNTFFSTMQTLALFGILLAVILK